jgi:hypothetical protein
MLGYFIRKSKVCYNETKLSLTPVRFIQNGISAIFRLGFRLEAGEEGGGRRRSPETGKRRG